MCFTDTKTVVDKNKKIIFSKITDSFKTKFNYELRIFIKSNFIFSAILLISVIFRKENLPLFQIVTLDKEPSAMYGF